MSWDPLTIVSSLVPSVPNESSTLSFSRAPTAECFRSFVLKCCCCELLVQAFASTPPRLLPSVSIHKTHRGGEEKFSGRKHVGLLSDLLAFNFRHGDRHAQVLRWPMGASLRLSYRRIYLVLFPLHHYSRPCGHLDGMFLIFLLIGFI